MLFAFVGCGNSRDVVLVGVWQYEASWGTFTTYEFNRNGTGTRTWYSPAIRDFDSMEFIYEFTWNTEDDNFIVMVFTGVHFEGDFHEYEDEEESYFYYSLSFGGRRLTFYDWYELDSQTFVRIEN